MNVTLPTVRLRALRLRGLCVASALVLAAHGAEADEPRIPAPAEAVALLRDASRSRDAAERVRAVEAVQAVDDPAVAKSLLAMLRKDEDDEVRAAVSRALSQQRGSAKVVGKRLVEHLRAEAEAESRRAAAGDCGCPIDPRTGDAATGPEAEAAMRRGAARAHGLAETIRALGALGHDGTGTAAAWTPFLQHPSDELVVATLDALGAARAWAALPPILVLYRMYPAPDRWETGAVVDLGGTNASAKGKWMVLFGHPQKQRARPHVVEALRKALTSITGRAFETPSMLALYLRQPDVERRLESKRR